jgi:hypothetical protein
MQVLCWHFTEITQKVYLQQCLMWDRLETLEVVQAKRSAIGGRQGHAKSYSYAAERAAEVKFCDDDGAFERQERSLHPQ